MKLASWRPSPSQWVGLAAWPAKRTLLRMSKCCAASANRGAVTAAVLSVSTALHREEAGPMRIRASGGQDFQMLFLLPHLTLSVAQGGGAQRQMGMRGLKTARGEGCPVTMA